MNWLIVLITMIFIKIQHVLHMIHVFYVDVVLIVIFSCTKDIRLPIISKTSFPVDNENLSVVDVNVVTIVFSCTKARATLSF